MTIKLTKRIASLLLNRGVTSIRIKESAIAEAEKAITREDVRRLISSKSVYALDAKENLSLYSKLLQKKKAQGRKRGPGRKKGTTKARTTIEYKQRIRAQRRVIEKLKNEGAFDNEMFKTLYRLVKGGTFASKASLLGNIKSKGINISDEKMKELKHI